MITMEHLLAHEIVRFLKPPKMKKVNAVERSPNWDIN